MMLVNLIGFKENHFTGYGIHTQALWDALQRIRDHGLHCIFTELRTAKESIEKNAAICRSFPGKVVNIWLQVGPGDEVLKFFPGIRVAYTVFETDQLPQGWAEGLNQADYVLTASAWGRQIMINNGVDYKKLRVVPEGVDPAVYHPWGAENEKIRDGKFNFLMVGKYEPRKGYDELIQAFIQTFGYNTDVQLLIKADTFYKPESLSEFQKKLQGINQKNIKLISGMIDDVSMASVYRSCDAFVFPSRGEGWGLPLIEAIACGLPVVSTYCTGHAEYLRCIEGDFMPIDTRLEPVPFDPKNNLKGSGNWYVPFVDSIADGMEQCWHQGKRKNLRAAEEMIKNFSWDASVRKLAKIIDSI